MALVVFDQGYRIETPTRALFTRRGVEQINQPKRATAGNASPAQDPKSPPGQPQVQLSPRARNAYQQTEQIRAPQTHAQAALPISKLMSRPVYHIQAGASVAQAWQLMRSHHVKHLAVLSPQGRLLGLLREHDLLRRSNPHLQLGPTCAQLSIEGAYSTRVLATTSDTEVRQVVLSFLDHDLSAMPVLDASGKLVGLVSRSDLLRFIPNADYLEQWA